MELFGQLILNTVLFIGVAPTIDPEGGLPIAIVRPTDFGDCLLIGIVWTNVLGDCPLIGIVATIDLGDGLSIGIVRTIDRLD